VALDLESSRWRSLDHAYGSAHSVPQMLSRLIRAEASSEREEAWFDIWSALCHQSDIYTASYAVVPHIIEMAAAAQSIKVRVEALHFAVAVEAYRHRPLAPEIPGDLAADYHQAVARIPVLVAENVELSWDEDTVHILCGALAIAKGFPRLGSGILELQQKVLCPNCDNVFVAPGWDFFE
jgi:hypothetical protein